MFHFKHYILSPSFLVILILCIFPQCRGKNDNNEQILNTFQSVSLIIEESFKDGTLNTEKLIATIAPSIDSIIKWANDQEDLDNRLSAQALAYQIFNMVGEKLAGDNADKLDIATIEENVISPLLDAIEQWFYDIEKAESIPYLWRDLFSKSGKETEQPSDGFFHIMVLPYFADSDEAGLQVFFPESAETVQFLAFSKDDDPDDMVMIPFDDWFHKGEFNEDYPVVAFAGQDAVDKMLSYDSMFIIFSSGQDSANADNFETAKLSLKWFQKKYQECVTDSTQ